MQKLAPLFVILAASLWGFDGIILRPYLYTLPVPLVVFLESTIIVILLSIGFNRSLKGFFTLTRKDWLVFWGVALMGGAVGTMAITKALFFVNYVNLSIVVLIQKLQPAFAILLAAILLKERPPAVFYAWAVVAIFGAYIMTFGWQLPQIDGQDKTAAAAFYAMLAVLGFASSTVLSKRALRNVDFKQATYLRFLLTAVLMLFVMIVSASPRDIMVVSRDQWGIFLLIALVTGGPGIFLYYYGLKRIRASVATICELAFPVTAVLLEFFVRDNILSLMQWLGVAVLFVAIGQVSRLEAYKLDKQAGG